MSPGKLLGVLGVLLLCEVGVFYARHHDVVRLAGRRDAVIADAGFPAAADAVLGRPAVTRRLLERIADVARARGEFDTEVRAIRRIVASSPDDPRGRLRLAQALRDAGQLVEAERIYRAELGLDGGVR